MLGSTQSSLLPSGSAIEPSAPDGLLSSRAFRQAIASLPAAVSILSTDGPAGRWGVTVSAVTSVSDAPPTVLACVNRSSRANGIVKANGAVAISVLAAGQETIADVFAGRADLSAAERFATTSWIAHPAGAPHLAGALVALRGRVREAVEVATHTVFMIAVEEALSGSGDHPAVYFRRSYRTLAD